MRFLVCYRSSVGGMSVKRIHHFDFLVDAQAYPPYGLDLSELRVTSD